MQNQNRKAVPQSKDSAGNMIFVGIICLAIGVAAGYYFGKTSRLLGTADASFRPDAIRAAVAVTAHGSRHVPAERGELQIHA